MIPTQLIERFKEPGELEREFKSYINMAGLQIDQSKTIAAVAYYDQKGIVAPGGVDVNFFAGTFDETLTNVGASYRRPESEHFVCYGIRFAVDPLAGAPFNDAAPVPGTNNLARFDNAVITVTNNGVVELRNYPISEALFGLTTKDQGLILLDEPIIWGGNTNLTVLMETKGNLFIADDVLRLTLVGIGLVS